MQISSSRPPWESSNVAREELALVVCNRSAAFYAAGDYLSSLIDAEVVISLRRPWSKGHYRKGRALLALGDLDGAIDAVILGLQFEPNNQVCTSFSSRKQFTEQSLSGSGRLPEGSQGGTCKAGRRTRKSHRGMSSIRVWCYLLTYVYI
jgi:hypothetical protein